MRLFAEEGVGRAFSIINRNSSASHERFGWGAVFVIVGVPGFLLAIMVWLIRDYTPAQNLVEGFPSVEV